MLTEGQLTAPTQKKLKLKKDSNRQKLQSFTDLSPGDLVVHVHHGIGRFVGIQRMPVDGVEKDYIKIDYAGGDCLYVPVTQLDLVSKYIGGGEEQERTRLNKLGGTEWAKQKTRARKAAKDLAAGLTKLYAERQRRPGFAFSPDSPWQTEFEEAFPYAETGDQLQAIADIKKDMEQPRPMDRLLCGDVGYGKTEVALRAVMKCILDGKQAAILVPTTVLAQQHYATACGRFRDFPVKIEVLSRFTTAKEQKRILEAARTGNLDLLIGTHKLLAEEHGVQGSGAAGHRRGAALRRDPQGAAQGDEPSGGRADPIRHPHPPDAEHGPLRPAGYDLLLRSLPPTASRCRPMCWSTTGPFWRTPCGRSWPGAARSTTFTTGWRPLT